MTPLPALAIVILLELIPLESPYGERGSHQWGIWLRFALTSFVNTFFILSIAKSKVPELELPRWKRACIAVAVSGIYNTAIYGLAQRVFPVPFQLVLGILPSGVLAILMARLMIGSAQFQSAYGLQPQMLWLLKMLLIKTLLMIVYPAYTTLFVSVSSTAQKILVPGLVLMKHILKHLVAQSAHHLADYLPVVVIPLVDVFNSLYMAVCMHSAGSLTTALTLMGVDILEAIFSLHHIVVRARPLTLLLDQLHSRDPDSRTRLMRMVAGIAAEPDRLDRSKHMDVCLHACLPHPLVPEDKTSIKTLFSRGVYRDGRKTRFALIDKGVPYRVNSVVKRLSRRSSAGVIGPPGSPIPTRGSLVIDTSIVQTDIVKAEEPKKIDMRTAEPSNTLKKSSAASPSADESLPKPGVQAIVAPKLSTEAAPTNTTEDGGERVIRTKVLIQSLSLLFHSEYLMLHRYVECVVPLVYLAHTAVIKNLDNNKYFPHANSQSFLHSNDLTIVITSFAQAVVMLVLHLVLYRRMSFSPLHQLSYVLEHQRSIVQGKFIVWIVTLIQFQLAHYGEWVLQCERGGMID